MKKLNIIKLNDSEIKKLRNISYEVLTACNNELYDFAKALNIILNDYDYINLSDENLINLLKLIKGKFPELENFIGGYKNV